jgi:hypothetical protein
LAEAAVAWVSTVKALVVLRLELLLQHILDAVDLVVATVAARITELVELLVVADLITQILLVAVAQFVLSGASDVLFLQLIRGTYNESLHTIN